MTHFQNRSKDPIASASALETDAGVEAASTHKSGKIPSRNRWRLSIIGPLLAVPLIASVLAVDNFKVGSISGSLVENAQAATPPADSSVLVHQANYFISMSQKKRNKPAKVLVNDTRLLSYEQWQRGTVSKGLSHTSLKAPNGKRFAEIFIRDGKSTVYSPTRKIRSSYKGVSVWNGGKSRSDELREKYASALYDQLSRDPLAFYQAALAGKEKMRVLGQATIKNRRVIEISVPRLRELRAKSVLSIDATSYLPVEYRESTPLGNGIELTFREVFTRFERVPATAVPQNILKFNAPKNTKRVAPKVFTKFVKRHVEKSFAKISERAVKALTKQ